MFYWKYTRTSPRCTLEDFDCVWLISLWFISRFQSPSQKTHSHFPTVYSWRLWLCLANIFMTYKSISKSFWKNNPINSSGSSLDERCSTVILLQGRTYITHPKLDERLTFRSVFFNILEGTRPVLSFNRTS